MKRLIIVASLAILAVGCQKTFVQNEVQTPIGFSTEVGKQTRAIVQSDGKYSIEQPFAVYAYAYQNGSYKNDVMDNVEVAYQTDVWKANDGLTYYWPNDPDTKIDFFAFSPYIQRPDSNAEDNVDDGSKAASKANVPHQVMTVTTLSHDKKDGLSFEGYMHSNPYVDFMEATPVKEATYSDPDGTGTATNLENGQVPMTFNHKMTQVVFKVTTTNVFPGVKFTVSNITLKNIKNSGNYSTANNWTATGSGTFQIFPADSDNGATLVNTPTSGTEEPAVVLDYTSVDANAQAGKASMTTTAVTMLPQTMVKTTNAPTAGVDTYKNESSAQMFSITYSIEGKGVATETVTKHVPFYAYDAQTAVDWTSNMRVVYTVSIGLNEITFMPSVADWVDDTDVPVEITPAGK